MRKAFLTAFVAILLWAQVLTAYASYDPVKASPEIEAAAFNYGEEYDISPYLLLAIMRYESTYTLTANNGDCKGLMQVNEPYHLDRMDRLGVTDLYDLDGNVHVGADYLAELYGTYKDWGIVLGLYHGESKAIIKGRKGIYSRYTLKILDKAAELEEDSADER